MAGVPCPSCRNPIGLTLEFIIRNPRMVCPHCETIMNFDVNDDIKKQLGDALTEIDSIKSKYKGTVKFN